MTETAETQEGTDPGRKPTAFWPAFRRLAQVFAPYKGRLIFAVVITLVSVALQVWAPLVLGEAVNVLFHTDGIDFARLGELITRVLAMYVKRAPTRAASPPLSGRPSADWPKSLPRIKVG